MRWLWSMASGSGSDTSLARIGCGAASERRHWATIEQVRLVQGDAEGAQSAQAQVLGCKVEGPSRF